MTEKEILVNIQRTYYLATALTTHIEWLRDYVKPDYKVVLNEAKSKINFMRKRIRENMSKEALQQIDEIGYDLLDKIWEDLNVRPK